MDVDVCHQRIWGCPPAFSLVFWWRGDVALDERGTHSTRGAGLIDHYLFTGDPYAMETLRHITDYTLDIYEKHFRASFDRRVLTTWSAPITCGGEMMIEYYKADLGQGGPGHWPRRSGGTSRNVRQKLPC